MNRRLHQRPLRAPRHVQQNRAQNRYIAPITRSILPRRTITHRLFVPVPPLNATPQPGYEPLPDPAAPLMSVELT
jgi:hypothetical protein